MNSPRGRTTAEIYSSPNTHSGYKPSHFDGYHSAPNSPSDAADLAAATAAEMNNHREETTPTYSSSNTNTDPILARPTHFDYQYNSASTTSNKHGQTSEAATAVAGLAAAAAETAEAMKNRRGATIPGVSQPSHFDDQYSAATASNKRGGQSSPDHGTTKRAAEESVPVQYHRRAPPPPPPPPPLPPPSALTGNSHSSTRRVDNHYADGNRRRKKKQATSTDTRGINGVGDYELEKAVRYSKSSVGRSVGTDDTRTRPAMMTTRDYELERRVSDRDQLHQSRAATSDHHRQTAAAAGSHEYDAVTTTPYSNLPQRK